MAENKDILLSLRRKLVRFEDDSEKAKAFQKRIRELESDEAELADLADLTLAKLREKASAADIEGRSSMSRDELIAALSEEE